MLLVGTGTAGSMKKETKLGLQSSKKDNFADWYVRYLGCQTPAKHSPGRSQEYTQVANTPNRLHTG